MTDIQRARLERMELWKRKKAAEAAAKSGISTQDATNVPSPTATAAARRDSPQGTARLFTALNDCVVKESRPSASASAAVKPIAVFALTRAAKTSDDKKLGFDEEDSERRKLEMLPTLTAEDKASINAAPTEGDAEDQDVKLDDDEQEERKHIKREDTEDIKMDIDEGDRRPVAVNQPEEDMKMDVEVDEDPLEAFMLGVDREARKIDEADQAGFGSKTASNTRVLMGADDNNVPELDSDGELPESYYAREAKLKGKGKEVAQVDHSKMKYEPFKKDFYIPPPEYANLTKEDIADMRLELNGITIRGKDVPVPITKWSQCGLSANVLEIIQQRLGWEAPTPIQAQAIPAVMSGRDVIGIAQTGSGKTAAFLLPMFRHILNQRRLEKMEGPIALVLSPTRELATQIHKDCKPFLRALDLRAICVYGGPPIKDHIAQIKTGAEIIVCTPGRMIDLMAANSGRVVSLTRVTYIVLDEADRQFDMGFEPQVMKIINNVRPDRQTVLFSATFPKQMEALARKILKRPVEITVGNKSVVAPEIEQIVEVMKEEEKFPRVLGLLGDLYLQEGSDDFRALIFVDRQEGADFLMESLLNRGYVCLSLHGGKDQVDRDEVIRDFKVGNVRILTATSVAARGLDVKQLKLVINYDCPNHMEDYVHRVGRTGRAGQTGMAVTFVTPDQGKYARDIVKALKLSGASIPQQLDELAAEYQKLLDSGRAYHVGSGFGGKGLDRFDRARATQRKMERKEHGGESDQEDEDKDVFDEDGERKVTTATTAVTTANGDQPPKLPNGETDPDVAEAVSKLNQTLHNKGQLRTGVAIKLPDPTGQTVQTLEINDLPQKARWAVTNRTNIAKVLEATGVSITTKGQFFPTGRLPGPGESKLHLVVEGETSVMVDRAMKELRRLLSDAADAALASSGRDVPTGRYSVT